MARTPEGQILTRQHRRRQVGIRATAIRDLTSLWRAVDPLDLGRTIGPFATAASVVVRARNRDSAAVAGRYFEAFRSAEGVGGALTVLLGEAPPSELAVGLLRGAGLAGIIRARRAGHSPQAAARNGFVATAGTASNLVLGGAREVITQATASDRASTGRWQRVTSGDPCAFCASLAARGPVFTAETADFQAHAACACVPEPAYEGTRLPPESEEFQAQWEQAQAEVDVSGTEDDALNAFRRLREGRAEIDS